MAAEKQEPYSKGLARGGITLAEITGAKTIQEKYADVTLRFVEDYGHSVEPLTPGRERKLLWKLYIWIMGLLTISNLMLFVSN